ncbi:MAG: HDIG domain-containing protein [Bacteroidaceae bacterium]|nr:HDIG domain-containing protein [Bacteroidaceae bacterium]
MERIDVKGIIDYYYPVENELKNIYMVHAEKVTALALEMARRHPELEIDMLFVEEAAMLHDLGIFLTDAPRIFCCGSESYLCHGYLGAELLRSRGYERHARVCERHTGTGLTKEQVAANGWNLPVKDFVPETIEEQLICFADKFYSKTKFLERPRTLEQVVESMRKISDESVKKIKQWAEMFM